MPNGPQDVLEVETPEQEILTPDQLDRVDRNPAIKRLQDALDKAASPEPSMIVLPTKKVDDTLRDLARFAIISRLLFRNSKNADILDALREAGHPMSLRNLQLIMKQSDFLEYYEKFRGAAMGPLDKQIRDDMKLTMPEAMANLVKLMRNAHSEKVKFDACIAILEGGGGLQKGSDSRKFIINVPPDLQKAMFERGRQIVDGGPPAIDVPFQNVDPKDTAN